MCANGFIVEERTCTKCISTVASIGKEGLQFESSFRCTHTTSQHPLRQKERRDYAQYSREDVDKNSFCLLNIGRTTEWC